MRPPPVILLPEARVNPRRRLFRTGGDYFFRPEGAIVVDEEIDA